MDHSDLFHDALTRVQDIAKNGAHNEAAWERVKEIVDEALAKAAALDKKAPG
jgi:hypothetical protein